MTPKEFFDKVVEMRRCQKEYLKNNITTEKAIQFIVDNAKIKAAKKAEKTEKTEKSE